MERPRILLQQPLSATGRLVARVLLAALTLALVVLGFFFLVTALILGGTLALVLLARSWWIQRKIRRTEEAAYLTTEYTVVEREDPPDPRLPPGP